MATKLPINEQLKITREEQFMLRAQGITKHFPGVIANNDVSVEFVGGNIYGLLGQNGSGKSTLCKILTGLYQPDAGTIEINGKPWLFANPTVAYDAGIFMVHQHFSLVEQLTVGENIVLGAERKGFLRSGAKRITRDLQREISKYGFDIDLNKGIWELTVGERQKIEIVKALSRGARLLILDEPTTVLTPQETSELFEIMRRLASAGTAIVFISHKLDEILAVCDWVTILNTGKVTGDFAVSSESMDTKVLGRLLVGQDIEVYERQVHTNNEKTTGSAFSRDQSSDLESHVAVPLRVEGLSVVDGYGAARLKNVHFDLRPSEILGIAGVAGNGQQFLAQAIAGLLPYSGHLELYGKAKKRLTPIEALQAGIAYIPQDRLSMGLAPRLSLEDNLRLRSEGMEQFSSRFFLQHRKLGALGDSVWEDFDIRGNRDGPAGLLSGGNAQKVVIARELINNPKVVIAESPTRGLDIAAIDAVRRLIASVADRGGSVIYISEDLTELVEVSDRILVLCDGEVTGISERADFDTEEIGLMMSGVTK